MEESLSRSAQKIQQTLRTAGVATKVVELPSSTRTAAEAAAAIGCSVAQIAKSILFRTQSSSRAVMVIASGVNRIDETLLAEQLGEPVVKADARFVREKTGFVIGGVPPVGHAEPLHTLMDRELLTLGELWAAAGTPNSVFRIQGEQLLALTGATLISVTGDRP